MITKFTAHLPCGLDMEINQGYDDAALIDVIFTNPYSPKLPGLIDASFHRRSENCMKITVYRKTLPILKQALDAILTPETSLPKVSSSKKRTFVEWVRSSFL